MASENLQERIVELVGLIRPGERIMWTDGPAEPKALVEAVIAARDGASRARAYLGATMSRSLDRARPAGLRFESYGAVFNTGTLAARGLLSIIPHHYSTIGSLIADGTLRPDVALVQVTPPDAQGRHSLGVVVDHMAWAVRHARLVIAEVNPHMPWTDGEAVIPAGAIHHRVSVSRPLDELPPIAPGPIEAAIAANLAPFVPDRAVIQMGIGALPNAVARVLARKKDLGIHSGIFGESFMDLIACGAVTNRYKEIDTGLSVTSFFIGTRRLYDFVNRNPRLRMASVPYTHGPRAHAAFDCLVAINAAVEVDLTGQVNCEMADGRWVGAVGGQGDFQRGAISSPRGRGIVALRATAPGGRSRIVPALAGTVSVARADADLVVTEFGAAALRGRTLDERAKALIAIAHPDHRAGLAAALDRLI